PDELFALRDGQGPFLGRSDGSWTPLFRWEATNVSATPTRTAPFTYRPPPCGDPVPGWRSGSFTASATGWPDIFTTTERWKGPTGTFSKATPFGAFIGESRPRCGPGGRGGISANS